MGGVRTSRAKGRGTGVWAAEMGGGDGRRGAEGRGEYGMPPHGGFAIGLERITACFLGIANVKECSMFPRDINRVAP